MKNQIANSLIASKLFYKDAVRCNVTCECGCTTWIEGTVWLVEDNKEVRAFNCANCSVIREYIARPRRTRLVRAYDELAKRTERYNELSDKLSTSEWMDYGIYWNALTEHLSGKKLDQWTIDYWLGKMDALLDKAAGLE